MSNCVKRKKRTKKITNKDLGSFCAVKELSIYKTDKTPTDKFVWTVLGFKNHPNGQTVYIAGHWAGNNVWKLPANKVILQKLNLK